MESTKNRSLVRTQRLCFVSPVWEFLARLKVIRHSIGLINSQGAPVPEWKSKEATPAAVVEVTQQPLPANENQREPGSGFSPPLGGLEGETLQEIHTQDNVGAILIVLYRC